MENENLNTENTANSDLGDVSGSALLAGFMGYELIENKSLLGTYSYRRKSNKGKDGYVYSALEYHIYNKDWNKIMPVVSKIQDTRNQYTYFHGCEHYDAIIKDLCSVDISSLFKHCVEFVKWWNVFQADR